MIAINLLATFIQEAREYLENINQGLLYLEENPADANMLDEIFRVAHTLKGSAGIAGLTEVQKLTHALEDVLGALRDGRITYDSELADVLLNGFDGVHELVEAAAGGQAPTVDYRRLITMIEEYLPSVSGAASGVTHILRDVDKDALAALPENVRSNISAVGGQGLNVYQICFMPDAGIFYTGTDPLLLVDELMELGQIIYLQIDDAGLPPLCEMDAELCYLGINIYLASTAEPARVEEVFQFVESPENHLRVAIVSEVEQTPAVKIANTLTGLSIKERKMFKEFLEQQQTALAAAETEEDREWRAQHITKILHRAAQNYQWQWLIEQLPGLPVEQQEFQAFLDRLVDLLSESDEQDLPGQETGQKTINVDTTEIDSTASPVSVNEGKNALPVPGGGPAGGKDGEKSWESGINQPIKVEQEKLDRLMSLAGELVVAKNALPYLVKKLEIEHGLVELAREMKETYSILDRIARDMQDTMLDVRLMPVSHIFRKMPRLVRDISRSLGKPVRLVTSGEETQLDKNIIQALNEPMVHLVRNALDHGVEPPEERQDLGKPVPATVTLRSYREGDRVIVEVEDDGRGIAPDRVRAMAVKKNLLTPEEAVSVSDEEALNFIFMPGFSTSEEVSDLSGRGVGMDVVATSLRRINGKVRVYSQPGSGTCIRMELPLTMVTSKVLLVEVSGQPYGLPLDAVQETVKLNMVQIKTMKGQPVAVLRNELVPLFDTGSLLARHKIINTDAGAGSGSDEEIYIVVLNTGTGLAVHDLLGEQDIILKPLEGELTKITIFAGAAILGDGNVLLVLNPHELTRTGGVMDGV
ncbi:chemotaxis protein CheA [Desulfallas sp. Bu1-1]|uniref:chemotaxis protein CheA n=1 Tax=Desulfallas sp. Bu1-1 TaxID=2787620 RepID=UPI00189F7DB2|nr:chemotaxis protein CheA [Desulfallas sp. Bu1-1]MBF7084203.1 chemotaxis protein CheA [Desulfallas sp. Bu1-1]